MTYLSSFPAWSAKSQSPRQKPAWEWKELNLRKNGRMKTFHGIVEHLIMFCVKRAIDGSRALNSNPIEGMISSCFDY